MANFTTAEANASTITKMKKISRGNTFSAWLFSITDADGNFISWRDNSIAGNASKATIKTAIRNHLVEIEKLPAPPAPVVTVHEHITNKGLGETVG